MADQIQFEIPGSFTLEQIQDSLIEREQMRNRKTTAMKKLPDGPDGHRNQATLEKQPPGTAIAQLILVVVPKGTDINTIKQAQPGKSFLFEATIWVENKETDVAAFR